MRIETFSGDYRWLSNFWHASVVLDDQVYPTVEHAYQAAKTFDQAARARVLAAPSPQSAKRAGRSVPMRPDWEAVKLNIMDYLLRQKFGREPLRSQLLSTGDAELVEGNWWNDRFWGVCRGVGENRLGKLLMQIRAELAA